MTEFSESNISPEEYYASRAAINLLGGNRLSEVGYNSFTFLDTSGYIPIEPGTPDGVARTRVYFSDGVLESGPQSIDLFGPVEIDNTSVERAIDTVFHDVWDADGHFLGELAKSTIPRMVYEFDASIYRTGESLKEVRKRILGGAMAPIALVGVEVTAGRTRTTLKTPGFMFPMTALREVQNL